VSVLETLLAPPRSAVVVPVDGDTLFPGSARWESFFRDIRFSSVDVFGLYPIVGVLHEQDARRSPNFMASHGASKDRAAIEEGALRLRTWLYLDGSKYQRIVFLSGGPLIAIWIRGVAKTPISSRIRLVPVRNGVRGAGSRSTIGLPGLEMTTTRSRLLHILGKER
jgi:hypothetical protein